MWWHIGVALGRQAVGAGQRRIGATVVVVFLPGFFSLGTDHRQPDNKTGEDETYRNQNDQKNQPFSHRVAGW